MPYFATISIYLKTHLFLQKKLIGWQQKLLRLGYCYINQLFKNQQNYKY